MLLFDGDGRQFSYDDSGFHVLINPGNQLPAANWLGPVDYYNGEFHVRYAINSPSDQQAGKLQTCIWTMGDDGACWDKWPNYENMNFRVTIVMVAAGESFSGWGNYP